MPSSPGARCLRHWPALTPQADGRFRGFGGGQMDVHRLNIPEYYERLQSSLELACSAYLASLQTGPILLHQKPLTAVRKLETGEWRIIE